MTRMRRSNRLSRARGIATLEIMLVTPVLVLLMAAIVEFGWAFHQYKTLTRATRDGVRHVAGAAMASGIGIAIIDSTLRQEARCLVVYGSPVNTGEPLLQPPLSENDVTVDSVDHQHVRVVARYQYAPLLARLPFFNSVIPTLEMYSSTVMRAL